jgi:hypothetical protein
MSEPLEPPPDDLFALYEGERWARPGVEVDKAQLLARVKAVIGGAGPGSGSGPDSGSGPGTGSETAGAGAGAGAGAAGAGAGLWALARAGRPSAAARASERARAGDMRAWCPETGDQGQDRGSARVAAGAEVRGGSDRRGNRRGDPK